MKTVAVDARKCTLQHVLREAKTGGLVFLTVGGNTRYVLAAADDSDREVCALRSNADFMAHLAALEERARKRPRKTLQQVRERFRALGCARRRGSGNPTCRS